MLTKTLALCLRAIRFDARALPSHVIRLVMLAFVVCMLVWAQLMATVFGAPGLRFFMFCTWVNFIFATLASVVLFATAITEEKETQTLGLLRMANVGALSLILGKTAPRLLATLLILSVQFPFTLLAITLGGVSWSQVYAAYWTLFSHVLLIGSIGLFASVIFRSSALAVTFTMLCVLLLIFVPLTTYGYFFGVTSGTLDAPAPVLAIADQGLEISGTLLDATAAARIVEILRTGFNQPAFGLQAISNMIGGFVVLLLAWAVFEPFNKNTDVAVRPARSPLALLRKSRRPRRSWGVPIIWKDFYFIAGGPKIWVVKFLLYGPLIWFLLFLVNDFRMSRMTAEGFGELLAPFCLFVILPLEAMLLSARVFSSEIKQRTWSSLLSLPSSLFEVAYSKIAGCALGLVPVCSYFWLGMFLNPDALHFTRQADKWTWLWIANLTAHFLVFLHLTNVFSVLTNTWLGLLLGIASSIAGAFALTSCVSIPVMVIMLRFGPGGPVPAGFDPDTYYLIAYWFAVAILLFASAGLHLFIGKRLRVAAAQ